jgi:hypothetical protein
LPLHYKPVQHVTVLYTVGNCNTVVSVIILYCNVMGPPPYTRSVVDRNVVVRRMTVWPSVSRTQSNSENPTTNVKYFVCRKIS